MCACQRQLVALGVRAHLADQSAPGLQVSDDLLKSYLDSYVQTPWDALKYLIAEANYGGRVTDELDRRVLSSYLNRWGMPRSSHCPRALWVNQVCHQAPAGHQREPSLLLNGIYSPSAELQAAAGAAWQPTA